MSSVNCAEELDFRLMFDGRQAAGPQLDGASSPSSSSNQALELQTHPFPPTDYQYQLQGSLYDSQGPQYGSLGNTRTFECPSIQITSIAPNSHVDPGSGQEVMACCRAEGGNPEASWGQLYLPLVPSYRDPALSASPCSSLSSRSWMSDLSSCESFAHDDVEAELRDAAHLALCSPVGSPGCGGGAFGVELWQQKYQHPGAFSPSLSPHQSPRQSPHHSPRTSVTEESWLTPRPTSRPSSRPTSPVTDDSWVGSPAAAFLLSGYQELDVPSKTRRTTGVLLAGLLAGQDDLEAFLDPPGEEGTGQDDLTDLFLQVPSHFSWNKPKPGNPPLFRASSPPPLDWPLPSQFDQYELRVEVQPRSYHRAHYETEGSRGSIKAATAGHPLVKLIGYSEQPLSLLLFIGTADDRVLRPHSFYQMHRVTGKTVTTSCLEKMTGGSKVLEIPLLPSNSMAASIDCAGILKLRNADIELKKGEMAIGRKNTRVRVVFRVALPQSDGRMLWLQTTSNAVECLVFMEKGPDGRSLWEMDARILPDKSSGCVLVVEVPRLNRRTSEPILVQFCVSNGKRRRSLTQNFTFLPAVKQEPDHNSHNALGPAFHQPEQDMQFYESCDLPVHCGPPHLHHPPHSSSLPPHSSSLLSNSSSLPPNTSSFLPNSSSIPPNSSLPPHSSLMFTNSSFLPPHSSSSLPNTSPLPPTSSLPPYTSSVPLHSSSLLPNTSSIPPYTSSLPHHTSLMCPHSSYIPPNSSQLPPQTSSLLPQITSTSPHTSSIPSMPPHTSSLPPSTSSLLSQISSTCPQSFALPPSSSSSSGLQRRLSPSLSSRRVLVTSPPPLKVSPPSSSIKQEFEERPESLGLQEITLDDVNEIIDRDISGLQFTDQQPYRRD
ncbi:hypothetical protein JOQ06_004081 [Pogonophryne albipinna]|uniref:RHD domain-containing protein n=1 Tax=Pogonophryne albipinna TaxID=1090488 RepID=A0AAD6AEX0_9TELE|nr:hypothetical protein JOQ06_004081 [Pogonophryne albipinna]